MSYVIYADVMYIWIFILNYLTYYITCRIAGVSIRKLNIILWSLISSIALEIVYINFVYSNTFLCNLLYASTSFLLMITFVRYILGIKSIWGFIRLITYSLLGSCLLCGIIKIFVRNNISFHIMFPVIIIICLILPIIHYFYPTSTDESRRLYPVIIITNSKTIKTTAYLDTGNTLLDMNSGNPVIILDLSLLMDIFPTNTKDYLDQYIKTGNYQHLLSLSIDGERIYPIPYKTISNSFSIMPAFKIKCLKVGNNSFENIVAGISPNTFSKGKEYQVLLNNNLKINREEKFK